jgi:hypothetical protein
MAKAILVSLVLTISSVASAQSRDGRVEAGVFITSVFLEEIGSNDHSVGTGAGGLGGRIGYRVLRWLIVEGELAVHPNAGISGHRVQAFLGARTGVRLGNIGVFAKARPGFLYFSKDPFGVALPGSTPFNTRWADSLEPTLDLGAVIEVHTSGPAVFRFDLGDTIVSYNRREVRSGLQPPQPAGGFVTHNRQWSLGVGMRF